MILEQALCDENEYSRLDKIRIGCKYISQQMPFMTTFNDSQTIKFLICCFPFSQSNVELLVSALFDRFKDLIFFNAFFKAVNEIAQYPEQKILLGHLRNQRQASRKSLFKNPGKETTQYSKQAIENLFYVKQFSSRYLYQLFQLGQLLEVDLEEPAKIFMKYLSNTREEKFITEIIDIFQNIKHDIFKNSLWSINLEDSIEQYFYSTQHPSTLTRIDTIQDYSGSENDSEIDMNDVIEKWICFDEFCFVKEQIEYFRNDAYFEFMMKFIFDPLHSQPIPEWKQNNQEHDLLDDYQSWKSESLKLEKIYVQRSRKLIKIITFDKNFAIIQKQVPQLLMKLFFFVYEAIVDNERAVNLQHIGYLVDYLLTQSPKSCLFYIVDLNLIFSFSLYLYNSYFLHIFEKLFNLVDDEYLLGMHVLDQFWLYVQSTNFFDHLTMIMTNENFDKQKLDRSYKTDQAYHIIPLLKAQANFDRLPKIQDQNLNEKKFLTDLLGQITPGKSPNEFFGMSQNNWHLYDDVQENLKMEEFAFKDLDNLKQFVHQRNQSYNKFSRCYNEQKFKRQRTIILNQHTSQSPQNKIQSTKFSALDVIKFEPKTTPALNSLTQPRLSSASKQNKWINVNAQKNYLRQTTNQKQQLLMNTSVRLRTFGSDKSDFSSNDGFSSSKLRTIYPCVKMKQETNFEKGLHNLQKKEYIAVSCAQIIKSITQTAFHYCWRKINTLGLCKQLYKLNMDLVFFSIITKNSLERIFQIYLLDIHSSNDEELSSSDECGLIINEIYSNYPRIKQQNKIIDQLKDSFINVADFLCKAIVKLNKQQHKMDHQQLNFKQFLLTDTLLYGLQMFESSKSQNHSKNPYLYLNDTVLHVLIIWYFDTLQQNIQQGQFVNLFILIMTRAPQHILLSLTFKLGFITSLYNFQSKYCKNGLVTSGVESFYLHLTFIIHIINESINNRNMQVISVSLNQLQSWQNLLNILPNPTSKAVLILNQRMKCTTIYVPTKVIVNQFHSLKSMDSDTVVFQPKIIFNNIKQKLHVPQIIQEQNKGVKFLTCVKEKIGQQKKLENLFKGK